MNNHTHTTTQKWMRLIQNTPVAGGLFAVSYSRDADNILLYSRGMTYRRDNMVSTD